MLIVFQGTSKRGHNVGAVTVMSAALEAFRTHQKVCVISLRNRAQNNNIEDFALPQEDNENASDERAIPVIDTFQFKDNGLDGLIRRAETGILRQDQFNNCVTPTTTVKNELDIVGTSSESDFEKHLLERMDIIKQILKVANEIYHYVFVCINSIDPEIIAEMNELADKIVVVARQGQRDQITGNIEAYKAKICMMITDFEPDSIFTVKKMKHMYGINRLFILPHNVQFRDAKESRSLIRFIMKNIDPSKIDENYYMIKEAKRLLSFIDNKAMEAESDIVSEMKYLRLEPKHKEIVPLERHSDEVQEETIEEKGFFFFKQPKTFIKARFTKKTQESQIANIDSSTVLPTENADALTNMDKDEPTEEKIGSPVISADIFNSLETDSETMETPVDNIDDKAMTANEDNLRMENQEETDLSVSAKIALKDNESDETSPLNIFDKIEEKPISAEEPKEDFSAPYEKLMTDEVEQEIVSETSMAMSFNDRVKQLCETGCPIDQIATELGITEDEVYTRYAQALTNT